MEQNELKPDFQKVAFALDSKRSHSQFYKDWKDIIQGKIHLEIKDNASFEALLKEYKLQACYDDLLFLACIFKRERRFSEMLSKYADHIPGKDIEILHVLRFLFTHKTEDIKITIKHRTQNNSVSINNKPLIEEIRKALLNYFIEYETDFEQELKKPQQVNDWITCIDSMINNTEKPFKQKGRKRKHAATGKYIDAFQRYLQEFTELKADEGIPISRKQASFIYKFLNIFELIPDNLSWEPDNIRHILKNFKEDQAKLKLYRSSADYITITQKKT